MGAFLPKTNCFFPICQQRPPIHTHFPKDFTNFAFISLLVQRNEPKKSRPWRFASRLKSGFPQRAPDSGVAMNSHIRALRQHDDPAPLSCTRLGCQTMRLKVKSSIPSHRRRPLSKKNRFWPGVSRGGSFL